MPRCHSPTPFYKSPTTLTGANFDIFLDSIETKNGEVATAEADLAAKTTTRRDLYELIKQRTLRVVDTVAGNEAWKQFLPKIKENARMVRNSRPTKAPEPPAPGTPARPRRKIGQQSFGDIDIWFEKLIEAVKLVPGYMPPAASNVQIAQLTTLLTDYRTANTDVATAGATLANRRTERLALYDAKTGGLSAKMKAIKNATGGQYGRDSA